MRIAVICIIVVVLASGAFAAEPRNVFFSKDLGISIEAPLAEDDKNPNYRIAVLLLPASDNFAANVNIQKQKYTDSIEAYDKLTTGQFKQLKMTVLNRLLKGNDLRYEYTGDMHKRTLHWYARAVKTGQHIYLVTATGLDSQWDQQKALLKKSVDSFVVKQ